MIQLTRINYLTVAMMLLFSYFSFGLFDKGTPANILLVLILSTTVYFMAIYLYFGIANMAFENRNSLLWLAGIAAVVLGYLSSGLGNLYFMLTQWSMLLFGGALAGRLLYQKRPTATVYIISASAVIVFAIVYFWPIWPVMGEQAKEWLTNLSEMGRTSAISSGYGADAVNQSLSEMQKAIDIFVRVLPALMVLSSVMQFSIGYLLFLVVLERFKTDRRYIQPFAHWKMPFWFMPLIVVSTLLILLGGKLLAQIGENILVFMIVFYAITGLALVEFYLKKFKFSLFLKIMFYLFLFMTLVYGFLVTVLLGFIDSFADWRKVQSLSFENE